MFEEFDHDIKDKETFIISQSDRIKTMFEVVNELKEYKIVLDKANKIVHGRFRSDSIASLHSVVNESGADHENPFGGQSKRRSIGSGGLRFRY